MELELELPKVINLPSVVYALKKTGQIRKKALETALSWGKGPMIRIVPLPNASGEFSPGIKSNEIRIKTAVVNEFEAGKGYRLARAGKVYLVGVTLLHELAHWADDQDGKDYPGEEGEALEKLLYGKVIY